MMTQFKLIATVAVLSLLFVETASAEPGYHHRHRHFYGYAPPVYAYPPPVLVAPAPIIVRQSYPPPVYVTPAPAFIAPAPVYLPPPVVYGAVGPRGRFGVGYASPGFGVYLGR